MNIFEAWIDSIKSVDSSMPQILVETLQEPIIEAQIVDWNVEQMNQGSDAESKPIDPPYAELTVSLKKIKGQPYNKVTLKDEGDFHASVKVKYGSDRLTLYATDPKTPKLGKKYGYQIFGLTDENIANLRIEVLPYLIEETRKILL